MRSIILWALILLLALGLIYFAYLGSLNRNYADDWCYNADFKELGFSQTIAGYTSNTEYASNRFSLTLFAGLFFPLGILGLKMISLFVLAEKLLPVRIRTARVTGILMILSGLVFLIKD